MQMKKITLASVVLVLLALAPACHSKKKIGPAVTPTTTESTAPIVAPPPPPPPSDEVKPREDFVTEKVQEEIVPTNVEELNRWAQQKGYIQDAFYNYDEATLDGDAQSALSSSATWLKSTGAAYNLLIEGHCDERGTEQYNLALGDRRANTAKDYLVTLGVDAGRIRTVSYGEERPFDEGHDDAAWAKNRRARLVLVR
jgi:peptidoglycan-associated lipoprotein